MSITNRTVTNTVTGETITFLERSAETGGVRAVAQITITPGGSVIPHSHRVSESFECLDGSFITHLAGKETESYWPTHDRRTAGDAWLPQRHGSTRNPQGHRYTCW